MLVHSVPRCFLFIEKRENDASIHSIPVLLLVGSPGFIWFPWIMKRRTPWHVHHPILPFIYVYTCWMRTGSFQHVRCQTVKTKKPTPVNLFVFLQLLRASKQNFTCKHLILFGNVRQNNLEIWTVICAVEHHAISWTTTTKSNKLFNWPVFVRMNWSGLPSDGRLTYS